MIVRLDDFERFKCKDLTANMDLSYILKSKMKWNQNILEERDKIIIGSMDSNFCVILAWVLYVEHSLILSNQDLAVVSFSIFLKLTQNDI